MPECDFIAVCPFFNDQLENMPGTAKLYEKTTCRGDFESCARFIVRNALGPDAVPRDLFPNDRERAEKLIR